MSAHNAYTIARKQLLIEARKARAYYIQHANLYWLYDVQRQLASVRQYRRVLSHIGATRS